jgi:hypothetical protein
MKPLIFVVLPLLSMGVANVSVADDFEEDFFGDIDIQPIELEETSAFEFSGALQLKVGLGIQAPGKPYNRETAGINKAQISALPKIQWQINEQFKAKLSSKISLDGQYLLLNRDSVDQAEIDEYQVSLQLKDAYLQGTFDAFWFRAGYQIVPWGEADSSTIADIINPRNMQAIGQADLEDIRVQVPALFAAYSENGYSVDGVITAFAGNHIYAPALNEFDTLASLRASQLSLEASDVTSELEYALRVGKSFNGGEINMVLADINWDDRTLASFDFLTATAHIDQARVQVTAVYGNWASGSWLFSAESGLHFGRKFMPNQSQFLGKWHTSDLALNNVGVEYSGINNWLLAAEINQQSILDHTESMSDAKHQAGFSSRILWNDDNQQWHFMGVFTHLANQGGDLARVSLSYDVNDALKLGSSVTGYFTDKETAALYPFRNNDVIELNAKYSF